MKVGVLGETDYIEIYLFGNEIIIEGAQFSVMTCAFGMDDDFSIGADLATFCNRRVKERRKPFPVGRRGGEDFLGVIIVGCAPEHPIAYFITRLNERWCYAVIFQFFQHRFGVLSDFHGEVIVGEFFPAVGGPLGGGVGPGVGVVEIEHQAHSGLCDSLAERDDVFKRLSGILVGIGVCGEILVGVYEEPHTHGVHAAV